MRVSEILNEGVEKFLSIAPSVAAHMEDTDNPHAVTKKTIGLENVTNDLQAKDADFRSHKEAAELDHPDGSVTAKKLAQAAVKTEKLESGAVTAEKIADGAVGGDALREGCITPDHLAANLKEVLSRKVDTVAGMGLSQNSFTDAEKAKLGAIRVVDGETHTLDTAALVLRDRELVLHRDGYRYTYDDDTALDRDAVSFISAETDEINGNMSVAYRDCEGVYTVSLFRESEGKWSTFKLPENTACHSIERGELRFAVQDGNVVAVKKQLYTGNIYDEGTFTLSKTGNIEVKNIFASTSSVRIVYWEHVTNYTILHVEKFNKSNGEQLWIYSKNMRNKEKYEMPDSRFDTIYDSRIRMVVQDEMENLYVSLVLPGNKKYAVERISMDGEVTGQYFYFESQASGWVLQEIALHDGKLYGHGTTQMFRIDTKTGDVATLWWHLDSRLRGMNVDPEGGVHLMTEGKSGDTRLFYQQGTRQGNCVSTLATERRGQKIDGKYLLARYFGGKLYLFYIPAGTNTLRMTTYTADAVYRIL